MLTVGHRGHTLSRIDTATNTADAVRRQTRSAFAAALVGAVRQYL